MTQANILQKPSLSLEAARWNLLRTKSILYGLQAVWYMILSKMAFIYIALPLMVIVTIARCLCISITLPHKLNPSSKLYELLSPLPLFNLRCGENDITCDFDWKHMFKQFCNTLLCQKGIEIDNVSISTSVIKAHLILNGISSLMANVLLDPNDKQDVVLMVKLLHAITVLLLPN